jgi:hypothetical protein
MIEWPDYLDRAFSAISIYTGAEEADLEAFASRWGGLDLEIFMQVLKAGQGKDKLIAIFALGFSGVFEAQALVVPLMQSHQRMERWASALVLGTMKDERALPFLQEMLLEGWPDQSVPTDLGSNEDTAWYENWRPAVASCLGASGNPYLAPLLRQALQASWNYEQQVAPSQPSWHIFRQFWHYFQDALASGLGQLEAFGALIHLDLPVARLRISLIHLVLGHLQASTRYRPSELIAQMMSNKELKQEVVTVLEQRFGFSAAEGAEMIAQFIDDYFARM